MEDGFRADPPVQYYTMGEERWRSSPAWPPPGPVWQSFFFRSERLLIREVAGKSAHDQHQHDRYQVDETATSGPGSRWGLVVGTGTRRGYGDLRERDRRLLTYTTQPLREDLEVTGHPIVRLFLSANAEDGAVFAYLEDVGPNGEVRYVTEGQLRLIHRKQGRSPFQSDPIPFRSYLRADAGRLVAGEVTEVVFDLLPTSFVFRPGHSIRLAIAGIDADVFSAPPLELPLVYEIHRDPLHPSRLELPTYLAPRPYRP